MTKEIRKLIEDQKKDRYSSFVKPRIIQPVKRKGYLDDLTPIEKMVWTCMKAGIMAKESLGKCLHRHPANIWRIYRRAEKKLKEKRNVSE